jgi:hypothetical protein
LLPLKAIAIGLARPRGEGDMKTGLACFAILTLLVTTIPGAPAQKPRVFITETTAPQASGDAAVGDVRGSLAFTGGNSPQTVEVMRAFERYCPGVTVTGNRDKAEYLVQFDHEAISPTTPFIHGNKVAVFDNNEDLIYSNSTRILRNAVKGACAVIAAQPTPAAHK